MFTGLRDISARPEVNTLAGQLCEGGQERKALNWNPEGPLVLQFQWEFEVLLGILDDLCPKSILEIGCGDGGTLWYWNKVAAPYAKIMCLDVAHWVADMVPGWRTWLMPDIDFEFLLTDSREQAAIERVRDFFPDGIDYLFIDGDHSYEAAKADFVNYGPMVNAGGVIALHDLPPGENGGAEGLKRLWQEIVDASYVTQRLYSQTDQIACGIGVVYQTEIRRYQTIREAQ